MDISNPLVMAGATALLATAFLLLVRPEDHNGAWTRAGAAYLLFVLASTAGLFWSAAPGRYALTAIAGSVVWLVLAPLVAGLARVRWRLEGSGESAMIFLAVIYHPLLLGLALLLRWGAGRVFG